MNKKILLSALALIGYGSLAFANGSMLPPPASTYHQSIYVGIQGGYGVSGWGNLSERHSISNDKTITGRVYAGIDLNKYLALEAGATLLHKRAKVGTSNIRTGIGDLMLKMHTPIYREFDLYLKAGLNYMYSAISSASNQDHINVAYGVGLEYMFTPQFSADAAWTRYNGYPKISRKGYQPNVDFYALGLRYRFFIM